MCVCVCVQVWALMICTISRRFYACEAWSFTLRKEHKLRLIENRLLREIVRLGWTR